MAQNIRISTNKSISVEKIIEAYASGERHFGGIFCDDGGISWNENQPGGIDLKGIDLSGTDLYVNWHDADLRSSYFRGSQLSQSNFRGANLSGADFSEVFYYIEVSSTSGILMICQYFNLYELFYTYKLGFVVSAKALGFRTKVST